MLRLAEELSGSGVEGVWNSTFGEISNVGLA